MHFALEAFPAAETSSFHFYTLLFLGYISKETVQLPLLNGFL
jgi:hypothetical protein